MALAVAAPLKVNAGAERDRNALGGIGNAEARALERWAVGT